MKTLGRIVLAIIPGFAITFVLFSVLYPQTKVDLHPGDMRATVLGSVNILEQPTNQTGDTWDVLGHDRAHALKVWRSGALLRPSVGYTESWSNTGGVAIKLATPLQPGEWVAWEKWTP